MGYACFHRCLEVSSRSRQPSWSCTLPNFESGLLDQQTEHPATRRFVATPLRPMPSTRIVTSLSLLHGGNGLPTVPVPTRELKRVHGVSHWLETSLSLCLSHCLTLCSSLSLVLSLLLIRMESGSYVHVCFGSVRAPVDGAGTQPADVEEYTLCAIHALTPTLAV